MAPKIESYRLPVKDVQKVMRNFPGYDEKEYYTIADMKAENQQGTSDTDSFTCDPDDDDKGYAAIYKKHGPFGRPFGSNSPHVKEN